VFTHFLAPVLPQSAGDIFQKLNTDPIVADRLDANFYNLKPGTKVSLGDILFKKIEIPKSKAEVVLKSKAEVKKASEVVIEDPNQDAFTKMEFRVGRVIKVWNHETADRLFCEHIDVGESEPRCVASGLRGHYSLEELQDRKVIVVCNLKESKIQGFLSTAMVLAGKAEDGSAVKLVEAPEGSQVGERVFVEGFTGPSLPASRIKKLKVWEAVSVDLRSNETGLVCWQGKPLLTSTGNVQVPLSNVQIS